MQQHATEVTEPNIQLYRAADTNKARPGQCSPVVFRLDGSMNERLITTAVSDRWWSVVTSSIMTSRAPTDLFVPLINMCTCDKPRPAGTWHSWCSTPRRMDSVLNHFSVLDQQLHNNGNTVFVKTTHRTKGDTILLSISLLNIDRFSQFFHRRTQLELCNKTVNKNPTSPMMCCYTTLWNVKNRKTSNNLNKVSCLTINQPIFYELHEPYPR